MKLYVSRRAPNPRRVQMFLAEKGIDSIESIEVSLMHDQHRAPDFLAKNPLARVPVLELDDGRLLCESRAICSWLDGRYPEPNLMGVDVDERAFIEMADRRAEHYLLQPIANWLRHCHPALASLEQPQFPDFGRTQADKMRGYARLFDAELAQRPFWAGERFTVADITAFCALEFARGLMKFRPGDEDMPHLQAWRDRIAARPSTKAGM